MTNDQARLDEAIAQILEMEPLKWGGWWIKADGEWTDTPIEHPSSDWNALMAAVARLEEIGWFFDRQSTTVGGVWSCSTRDDDNSNEFPWLITDRDGETDALALCIWAVMEKDDG